MVDCRCKFEHPPKERLPVVQMNSVGLPIRPGRWACLPALLSPHGSAPPAWPVRTAQLRPTHASCPPRLSPQETHVWTTSERSFAGCRGARLPLLHAEWSLWLWHELPIPPQRAHPRGHGHPPGPGSHAAAAAPAPAAPAPAPDAHAAAAAVIGYATDGLRAAAAASGECAGDGAPCWDAHGWPGAAPVQQHGPRCCGHAGHAGGPLLRHAQPCGWGEWPARRLCSCCVACYRQASSVNASCTGIALESKSRDGMCLAPLGGADPTPSWWPV